MTGKPVLLFLCVHNSGRSQMAAAFARRLGGDRVTVMTGGSAPAREISATVRAAMTASGIDLGTTKPRKFTAADVHSADVVVTMGCGDACPAVPGRRFEDWMVADPAEEPRERVEAIRDAIRDKVEDLLFSLGIAVAPDAPSDDSDEEE